MTRSPGHDAGRRSGAKPGADDAGRPRGAKAEALALVGPTATGKTPLAIEVCRRLDGEVVSADSRQAYRGMEVGTAAPTTEERAAVPHHGVSFLDPRDRYGAGRFARLARRWLEEVRARGRVPVLVGGTGFFLDALVSPIFREPALEEDRRHDLRRRLSAWPAERLEAWARRLDAPLFERLETVDPQRAARTVELALLSGRPVTWWQEHGEPEAPPLRPITFVLELPAHLHRERIERRAARLLESGWPEEASRLRASGLEGAPALDAVGYRHVFALLDGEVEREEALRRIVADTWTYARRQRTWFRNRAPAGARRLDATRPTGQLAARVVEAWRAAEPHGEGRGRSRRRGRGKAGG